MYTADEIAEIVTIQHSAIPQMIELNIPVNPHNYTLWYRYTSGEDAELNSLIDTIIKRNEEFTEETLSMLYSQFCDELSSQEIEELRDQLMELVTELYVSTGNIVGESTSYGTILVNAALEIADCDSIDTIKSCLTNVIDQTKKFGAEALRFANSLKKSQAEIKIMENVIKALREDVRRDELTKVNNRKAFDETLEQMISLGNRKRRPFSLLLLDIDHFKKVNDTYGHLIGDEVLVFIAKQIGTFIRKEDVLSRFGGEEFALILPETGVVDALTVANNIVNYFSTTTLKRQTEPKSIGKVTVSIGVAEYQYGESGKELCARADAALYDAKDSGRNCVSVS